MAVIQTSGLTHRYGGTVALADVSLAVPEGAFYALVGPNGAGKTTLYRILMGLLRPSAGSAAVLGAEVGELTLRDRARIAYVAEGQRLPGWMRLAQLEAYLAPLYPSWDGALAAELRRRLRLDGARRIGAMSRGERMKAALLCALAPRPRLLLMDEPFTGMDVLVKDELVGGLLEAAGTEGWTIVVSSHDLGELEMLSDWVGFLDRGRLLLSEPVESLRARFRHVDVLTASDATAPPRELPAAWLAVRRSGRRLRFLTFGGDDAVEEHRIREWVPEATRVEVRPGSLREIFAALAGRGGEKGPTEEARP